jgi:hypothetical protein
MCHVHIVIVAEGITTLELLTRIPTECDVNLIVCHYFLHTAFLTSPLSLSIGWNGCGLPFRLLVHTSRGLYGPSTTFILPLKREHFILYTLPNLVDFIFYIVTTHIFTFCQKFLSELFARSICLLIFITNVLFLSESLQVFLKGCGKEPMLH